MARTIGAAISPLFVGSAVRAAVPVNVPFFIAGTLKIVYDLLLFRAFRSVSPPDEVGRPGPTSR